MERAASHIAASADEEEDDDDDDEDEEEEEIEASVGMRSKNCPVGVASSMPSGDQSSRRKNLN